MRDTGTPTPSGRRRRALIAAFAALPLLTAVVASPAPAADSTSGALRARLAAFRCPASAERSATAGIRPIAGGRRLVVATTVAPITSIVANVAGGLADVQGIVPEGTNSHTFEPKPSAARLLSRADLVFINGLKLEDPTRELATANLGKGARIVELGTLTLPRSLYIYDFSFPREGGKPNPHLWTNPPMAACYARIAAAAMAAADPANAVSYRANATAWVAKADELDRLMQQASASIPAATRKLLTYHDAYAYFAARYGWQVIGAVQVSSFEDPTPKEVAALITQVRREKVRAVFGSEVFPSSVLAQIAKEAGVRYVDEMRDDDLPGKPGSPEHSILGLLQFDFLTMIRAMGGSKASLAALQQFDPADVSPAAATYPQ